MKEITIPSSSSSKLEIIPTFLRLILDSVGACGSGGN
jgi:hypothetical protein